MGEEAEGKGSSSGDCDCDCNCNCVVEWWGLDKNSLKLGDMCWWGGHQQCRVDIIQVFFIWLFLLFVFTSTIVLMG